MKKTLIKLLLLILGSMFMGAYAHKKLQKPKKKELEFSGPKVIDGDIV